MPTVRAQVVLFHDTGLPEDVTVNTFHLITTAVGDWVNAAPFLEAFYNEAPAGNASALMSHLSVLLSGQAEIRFYNLADPEPRVPIDVWPFTITPDTLTMPTEVALCASMQADQASGQPQARRRGRVFIGPWGVNANTNNTGRPTATVITTLAKALRDLIDASVTETTWSLAVYSVADAVAREVTNGWVDNAWDTQRRRGIDATARTLVDQNSPA